MIFLITYWVNRVTDTTEKTKPSHKVCTVISLLIFMYILDTATLQAYPLPEQEFISLCESNDAESLKKILEAMPLQERLRWAEGHHGYPPLKTYFHKSEDSLSADFLSVLLMEDIPK